MGGGVVGVISGLESQIRGVVAGVRVGRGEIKGVTTSAVCVRFKISVSLKEEEEEEEEEEDGA